MRMLGSMAALAILVGFGQIAQAGVIQNQMGVETQNRAGQDLGLDNSDFSLLTDAVDSLESGSADVVVMEASQISGGTLTAAADLSQDLNLGESSSAGFAVDFVGEVNVDHGFQAQPTPGGTVDPQSIPEPSSLALLSLSALLLVRRK